MTKKYYIIMNKMDIDTILNDMLISGFNNNEQQIFLQHFKGFLNKENDFIINIEFAFKWIGFVRKDISKRLLDKFFTIDIDYINFHSKVEKIINDIEEKIKSKGRPNEIILMTP